MQFSHFPPSLWLLVFCLSSIGTVTILTLFSSLKKQTWRSASRDLLRKKSGWLFRTAKGYRINETVTSRDLYNDAAAPAATSQSSPFLLPKGTSLPKKPQSSMDSKLGTGFTRKKTIAYYDPLNEQPTLMSTVFSSCEFSSCRMTRDVRGADVLLLLATKLKRVDDPDFRRRPDQIWVLKTDEAPSRFSWFETLDRPGIRDAVNWTMTHKLDSDIPMPYGKLVERDEVPVKNYETIFAAKTKMAAWFVSHCPVRSRRMIYISRMRQRLDVDIFGKCGDMRCGMAEKIRGVSSMRRLADNETCLPMLSASYKYYLAFENSLCQEYVTEKFFKIFQDVDVVPVVRGGADYQRYFPKGSFIDAADFSNPEDLADYLVDLANDKDRYIRYLKNKNRYQLVPGATDWHCNLCRKMHTDRNQKTYDDIRAWFIRDSCHDPVDSLDF